MDLIVEVVDRLDHRFEEDQNCLGNECRMLRDEHLSVHSSHRPAEHRRSIDTQSFCKGNDVDDHFFKRARNLALGVRDAGTVEENDVVVFG